MADSIPFSHDDIDRRFRYHPPTAVTVTQHERVRDGFAEVAHTLVDELPDCPERVVALHKLQEALMWSNAAIACSG